MTVFLDCLMCTLRYHMVRTTRPVVGLTLSEGLSDSYSRLTNYPQRTSHRDLAARTNFTPPPHTHTHTHTSHSRGTVSLAETVDYVQGGFDYTIVRNRCLKIKNSIILEPRSKEVRQSWNVQPSLIYHSLRVAF